MLSFIPASVNDFFEAHPIARKCSRKEDPSLIDSVIKTTTNSLYTLKYKQLLGETGSEGKVKKGFTANGTPVAIKVITLEPQYAYISQEIAVLAKLNRLIEITSRQNSLETRRLYIIQTLVPGSRLFDKLQSYDMEQKLIVAINLVLALSTLFEEHRIVHGDVKAENVMVDEDLEVTLVDFGFSQILPEGADIVQGLVNSHTPGYGAPEVVNQKYYSVASDIYALGQTFSRFHFPRHLYASMINQTRESRPSYLQVLGSLLAELNAQSHLSDKARTKIEQTKGFLETRAASSSALAPSNTVHAPTQTPWTYGR